MYPGPWSSSASSCCHGGLQRAASRTDLQQRARLRKLLECWWLCCKVHSAWQQAKTLTTHLPAVAPAHKPPCVHVQGSPSQFRQPRWLRGPIPSAPSITVPLPPALWRKLPLRASTGGCNHYLSMHAAHLALGSMALDPVGRQGPPLHPSPATCVRHMWTSRLVGGKGFLVSRACR